MRIRCCGPTTAINTHYELAVLGAAPFRMMLSRPQYWTPVVGGPEELRPTFERSQLALSPSGTRVAVPHESGSWVVVEIAARVASRSTADALAFITDERLLSVLPFEGAPDLYGLYPGRHGAVPERLALPEARRVEWPEGKGRVWDGAPPWEAGGPSARTAIYTNEHGHAAIDPEAGWIVRIGADADADADADAPAVLRVPTEGPHSEIKLSAYATREGVLVAYSGGRGAGVVTHFARDGRHLGAVELDGNVSDVCVSGTAALFLRERSDYSGNFELVVASLPELGVREVVPTTVSTYDGSAGLDARDDGREVWIGSGTNLQKLLRAEHGWVATPVDLSALPLVEIALVPAREVASAVATAEAPRQAPPSTGGPREVVHPKFGAGRVVAQTGSGEGAKLQIEFADGIRTLLSKFVRDR